MVKGFFLIPRYFPYPFQPRRYLVLTLLAIYDWSSVFQLVIKPVAVLLEDQRSKANCKRNIKANLELTGLNWQYKAVFLCSSMLNKN